MLLIKVGRGEFERRITMQVGLVIPCYLDVFYPQVGIATLELLERLGVVG